MSSVDLHTHSGFQRMLPESFAVVCAPKFNPKYVYFFFALIEFCYEFTCMFFFTPLASVFFVLRILQV